MAIEHVFRDANGRTTALHMSDGTIRERECSRPTYQELCETIADLVNLVDVRIRAVHPNLLHSTTIIDAVAKAKKTLEEAKQ